jgi:hypothetical protein
VGARKRAILDVDLTGRDAGFGAAVNKKPAKTTDLNAEKFRYCSERLQYSRISRTLWVNKDKLVNRKRARLTTVANVDGKSEIETARASILQI